MITLKEFIEKYKNKEDVGNTPGNIDQCVGLVMVWVEELGLPHFWGHAKDLYSNAPETYFKKILNTENAYPIEGDIMVYDATWGGGYGHTGIIVSSDPENDSYKIFEQNIPIEQNPRVVTRNTWSGVIGWLRPRNYTPEDGCPELRKRIQELEDKLKDEIDSKGDWRKKANQYESENEVLAKKLDECQEKLQLSNEDMSKLRKLKEDLTNDLLQCSTKRLQLERDIENHLKDKSVLNEQIEALDGDVVKLGGEKEQIATNLQRCEFDNDILRKTNINFLHEFSWWERFISLFKRGGGKK